MTTLQAYWLVLRGRLRCHVLHRHEGRVWMSRGCSVSWCRRCLASRVVEVAPWG